MKTYRLTKEDKNKLYIEAKIFLQYGTFSLCTVINCACYSLNIDFINIDQLPELMKFKPENVSAKQYWFPLTDEGSRQRFDILTQAINETN